jgi:glyoxylase-like metal-dependent hydrolase (beta-lactamase superfamily II)
MNRPRTLVSVAVAMVAAYASLLVADAQGPTAKPSPLTADQQRYRPGRPDLSLSGIEVLPVQGNVYLIATGKGSNIVAQVGDQGALLVDASLAEVSDQVLAEVRKLTRGPIKGIANTTIDPDHIGGNARLSVAGQPMFAGNIGFGPGPQATIFAHEKASNRLTAPTGQTPAVAESLLPTDTFFGGKKKISFNHEPIEFHHAPGHTDGDMIVWFRRSDVIAAGDVFTTTSYPKFDPARGGTMQGILDGLNHLVDRVRDARAMGRTLDQIKAAKVTLEYDGLFSTPSYTGDMFVEAIYNDLARTAPAAGRRAVPKE